MSRKRKEFYGSMTDEQRSYMSNLFVAMYSTIYHYAVVSLQNPDLAEEMTQIVFAKACGDPEGVMCSTNANGWLVKTLRHALQEYYRNRDRDNRLTERSAVNFSAVHRDDYFDVEFSDLLEPKDMELLRMVDVEGYSTRDAAKAFGISDAACRKRLQRAREKLREKII